MKVRFYNNIEDDFLKFAVIVSRYKGKWVFCKHKDRNTFEVPGGRREKHERILDTAKRELFEETGATDFTIQDVAVYSVKRGGYETFGKLYFAEINEIGPLPDMEIEKIICTKDIPNEMTYPLIQPKLHNKVEEFLDNLDKDCI